MPTNTAGPKLKLISAGFAATTLDLKTISTAARAIKQTVLTAQQKTFFAFFILKEPVSINTKFNTAKSMASTISISDARITVAGVLNISESAALSIFFML